MILLLNHISYPRWEMGLGHIAWICDNSLRQASLSRATKPLMATPRGRRLPPTQGGGSGLSYHVF